MVVAFFQVVINQEKVMQSDCLRLMMLPGVLFVFLNCGGVEDSAENANPITDNTGLTGAQLYAANCVEACHQHGDSAETSVKINSSAAQIKNAISTQPQMSFLQGKLTDAQLDLIANALKQ